MSGRQYPYRDVLPWVSEFDHLVVDRVNPYPLLCLTAFEPYRSVFESDIAVRAFFAHQVYFHGVPVRPLALSILVGQFEHGVHPAAFFRLSGLGLHHDRTSPPVAVE